MPSLRRLAIAALLALPAWVASEELPEYRLKAAFVYNFAQFAQWPDSVGPTLNVCVYGRDPFGVDIDALRGSRVGTRSLDVRRPQTVEALKDCHIVFIANSAIEDLPRILSGLGDASALTIADTPGAARHGVALNMIIVQKRVVFEANVDSARRAHIVLSSKLLRLAREVYP